MKTVALFVCDPKCSVQSSNGIINALNHQYNIKLFSKNEVEDGFFDDIDMIIVPGGFGDSDSYDNLLKYNQDEIRKFIKNGGKYLGICMGAYWAGKHYFNILDGVEPVQYIKRPKTDTKRPHAKNIDVVWENNPMKMFFYDGCALVGNPKKFKSVATYANGDHMAIIQKNIGLIGCHPESEKFWYEGYSWLKGKYHEGIHHKLLLEFINELGKK
jgi:glutamine amidotransferase PdxT